MLTAFIAVLNLPTYFLLGRLIFGSWQETGAAILAGFQFLGRRHPTIEHLAELADESYEPPDYWLVGKLVWFVISAASLVAMQVKIVGWLLGAE